MRKVIAAIVSALVISQSGFAQIGLDVCGIPVGAKLTKNQVIAKFGEPVSYKVDNSYGYFDIDGSEKTGKYESYKYENARFDFSCDCGLDSFEIYSKDFPVLTKEVDAAGVRVGQKADILKKYHLEGEKAIDYSTEYSRKIGGDWYYYDNPSSPMVSSLFLVLIKDGIIYGFQYNMNVV